MGGEVEEVEEVEERGQIDNNVLDATVKRDKND